MPKGGETVPKVFKISKSVSNAAWGDIDKSRIWQLLKQGIEEGAEGVAEAVREVYAIVGADINKDLTQADCKLPHHEVREDGTVILNRGGLIAAAAALAGARSEVSATPEQKAQARRHLLRHYRELEMPAPESLVGEMSAVMAVVSGEMRVEDVPLAPWADLAALKAGDPEPMEVVVEIPAGRSKRGWNYTPQALQRIVGEVMNQGLPGFLGHQKPEDVDHEFPVPVTHWVGALWKDGKAYFRGVIDKAASDLKRWIKAKTVRTVSIFGIPKLEQTAGETRVIDYQPLSIDWTPLGRAGMQTAVVAVGEMDEIISGGGQKPMTWKELVAQLKTMLASREVTLSQVVGEMGWKVQEIAGEIAPDWLKVAENSMETMAKVKQALGVTGEMDVVKVAEEARKAVEAQRRAEHDKLVADTIKEKVTGEMAQGLISKMLHVADNATKEQIAGEIDNLLKDQAVKDMLSKLHIDIPPGTGGSGGGGNTPQNLKIKRVTL
ncbi:MAG: hypothetical protein HPY52_10750 [Firmicutes bacterium]|nr:hypothetical protein [Bacillota bacterium]